MDYDYDRLIALNWIFLCYLPCQTCCHNKNVVITPLIRTTFCSIVEKDAIAFIQRYNQGRGVFVWESQVFQGGLGLNPVRKQDNWSSGLAGFCWACTSAHRHNQKLNPSDCFLFVSSTYAGARSKARVGFESRSNVKKRGWNPSVISFSFWRSIFITGYI